MARKIAFPKVKAVKFKTSKAATVKVKVPKAPKAPKIGAIKYKAPKFKW